MPPNIDDSLTSSDVIAQEGDNVSLKCKANGSPPPSLKWKRDDGSRMVINKSLEGKVSRKDKTRHLSYWLLIFFSFFSLYILLLPFSAFILRLLYHAFHYNDILTMSMSLVSVTLYRQCSSFILLEFFDSMGFDSIQ